MGYMLGILGILLSLVLLMYLAYRGISVIILAPALAMLATFLAGDMPLMATYTQIFMKAMGGFAIKYFPIFLLGAVFGKLMEDSGSAAAIARAIVKHLGQNNAVLSIVLSCGLLTYAGVSAFVVVFAVYPLGAALFRELNVPKRLVAGAIALGAFTFSMTAFPGSIQIHNIIPTLYFKTTTWAAPLLGAVAGTLMMTGGVLWLQYRARKAMAGGEGYGDHADGLEETDPSKLSSLAIAALPVVLVVVLNYVLVEHVIPTWDTSYLSQQKFGNVEASSVSAIWAMILSLLSVNVLLLVLHRQRIASANESLTQGALGALLPTFNTASEVGYGKTIASLAAFVVVKEWVLGLSPDNPLVSAVIATNILAGITGSASGGMSIALEALGASYYQLAAEVGISTELLHRFVVMASGGFDTLPHNGAVITLLAVCGLTHRQSYGDICMVSLIIPVSTTFLLLTITSLFFV
jgi:H+/gluconate symporter-like permease